MPLYTDARPESASIISRCALAPVAALFLATAASAQDPAQLVARGETALGREPSRPDARAHSSADFRAAAASARRSRAARRLVVQYCVQCHNLPNPAMHHAAKWPAIFERMVVRMRGKGNMGELMHEMMAGVQAPSDEEARVLLAYLRRNAQKPIDPKKYPELVRRRGPLVQARLRAVPRASRSDCAIPPPSGRRWSRAWKRTWSG